MNGGKPEGGKWNYDSENRKSPPEKLNIPEKYITKPDQITEDVIQLVEEYFTAHFGDLEPFFFAVSRDDALLVLSDFIKRRLENFGDYQDAMHTDYHFLYHSKLSFALNIKLIFLLATLPAPYIKHIKKQE